MPDRIPGPINPISNNIVQVVNVMTGAVATGTTIMPFDDTIPQNTEGNQYMSLAITPTNANNKLFIQVVLHCSPSSADEISAALFQDTIVDALAASTLYAANASGRYIFAFSHYMTAGTLSSITFKVRAGGSGAITLTFNGTGGARRFGGVLASSITITEIAV